MTKNCFNTALPHHWDTKAECRVCGQGLYDWALEQVLESARSEVTNKNRVRELQLKVELLERELEEDVVKITELGQELAELRRENAQLKRASRQYEEHLRRKMDG